MLRSERWTRFRSCCCTTRASAARARRSARRTSASGRPGPGAQFADEVRALACGLAGAGLQARRAPRDDRRQPAAPLLRRCAPRSASAAIPVPLYQDAVGRRDGVPDPERRDRASRSSRTRSRSTSCSRSAPQCPTLAAHLLRRPARPAPLRAAAADAATSELLERGPRVLDRAHPGFFDARDRARARGRRRRGDVLHLGHDRQAEGRGAHARQRCIDRARSGAPSSTRLGRRRRGARLPAAGVGRAEHLSRYAQWLVAGFTINCPESADTVMTDMREIGPTYYFAPPRVFESLLTQVMIRMEDAGALKRWLFHHFMARRAPRAAPSILDGKPVGAARPAALRARQPARLRPAAQRARHEPHPRRLHRRARRSARTCSASTARSAST